MSSSTDLPATKPLLLITSFPGDGHTGPMLRVAAGLIHRGWDVVYLGGAYAEDKIRSLGVVDYFEAPNPFTPDMFAELGRINATLPLGPVRYGALLACVFWRDLQARTETLQRTLEALREREPGREIVVIEDGPNMASVPFRYGRALPRGFDAFPKTLGVSPCPLLLQSVDSAPSPLGLLPDSSPSGRMRNAMLNQLINEGPFRTLYEQRERVMRSCECTSIPQATPTDSWFVDYDQTVLLCSPSLEYEMSDAPLTIKFAGCLPRQLVSADLEYPPWWSEVTGKDEASRKLVFVTQGTINVRPDELILPTTEAFSNRPDILVVAVLGSRGASLPPSVADALPSNVKILDYFPYDAILAHADVFVSNAGYGSLTHTVINGVPAVFAGQTQEKAEVAARAAMAGLAVNLQTHQPAAEDVRRAVDEVLGDVKYKTRAEELQAENEAMDPFAVIDEIVRGLTKDQTTMQRPAVNGIR